MSIDYGNCDMEDCWYGRNSDRLNEYCDADDVRCVSNVDYDGSSLQSEGLDIDTCLAPCFFTLCGVCWANSHFTDCGSCDICNRIMVDTGLALPSRNTDAVHTYCRECMGVDDLIRLVKKHVSTFYLDAKIWADLWEPVTWERLRSGKVDDKITDAIRATLDAYKAELDTQHLRCEEAKRQAKRKVIAQIHHLAPHVSLPTSKRVRRAFQLETPPDSLEDLFNAMAQRHEVCGINI